MKSKLGVTCAPCEQKITGNTSIFSWKIFWPELVWFLDVCYHNNDECICEFHNAEESRIGSFVTSSYTTNARKGGWEEIGTLRVAKLDLLMAQLVRHSRRILWWNWRWNSEHCTHKTSEENWLYTKSWGQREKETWRKAGESGERSALCLSVC